MARGGAAALLLLLSAPLASGLAVQAAADPNATALSPDATDLFPSTFERELYDPLHWRLEGMASGNPKLQNYNGQRFQIHQAGEYNLLSVPHFVDNDPQPHGSRLTVSALYKRLKEKADPCVVFMKRVTVAGSWLSNMKLVFRAESIQGDFAMRLDSTGHRGEWRSFQNMSGLDEEVIYTDETSTMSISIKAIIGRHEARQPSLTSPVEHRFVIRMSREDQLGKKTELEISQPKPGASYLDFKAIALASLEIKPIYGILGEGGHDDLTFRRACAIPGNATKRRSAELMELAGGISTATAYWYS